jgi:superfamily II DNA or RNA helicase
VANLKTVIMTNSLDSPQSNTQVLGRLRRNDTMPQRFAYLVCLDVEKQVQYHSSKKELLAQRAKNYNELFMPFGL